MKDATASNPDVATALRKVLADTWALYAKTHGYHWKVVDARFSQLHTLFEEQYTEIWAALDVLAEQIRSSGELAPQGIAGIGNLSGIGGGDPTLSADAMIADVLDGHRTIIGGLNVALAAAEGTGDPVSADVLTGRLAAHQKHAWMLRATSGHL